MNNRSFKRTFAFHAVLCMLFALITLIPARADFIGDAEWAIDQTGALPFKFSEWKPVLDSCTGDDMVACADVVSQSPTAQSEGMPSYLPQMINVYFDLKHKDYWGLLSDAGETVACAAAQILTSVDVCGAIKTLINAAATAYNDAKAAANFLADLGAGAYDALKGLGCDLGFWGCDDDGPPPPTADQLAQAFVGGQIAAGVQHIESSFLNYVDFRDALPDVGQKQGFSYKKIVDLLNWYDNQVEAQWDAWVLQNRLGPYNKAVSVIKDPSTLSGFVSDGTKHLKDINWNPALDPDALPYDDTTKAEIMQMYLPLWQYAVGYCKNSLDAAGAPVIADWLQQDRPKATGLPAPADPGQTCQQFNFKLKQQLTNVANLPLVIHWIEGCTKGQNGYYTCDNRYHRFRCNAAFYFVQNKGMCGWSEPIEASTPGQSGPAPTPHQFPFACGPSNTIKYFPTQNPPPGCHKIGKIQGAGGAVNGQPEQQGPPANGQ